MTRQALLDLQEVLPEIINDLEDAAKAKKHNNAEYKAGLLDAADLIEGYFLAGKARKYTQDDTLCRLLMQAIHEKASEFDED